MRTKYPTSKKINTRPTGKKQNTFFDKRTVLDTSLRGRFIEPPFTVLDTKSGNWQKRKKDWRRLGIESEVGRDAGGAVGTMNSLHSDKYGKKGKEKGQIEATTSIFDPALCELLYNWFCPEGGTILDPFAGGSVRGIIANYLGYKYTGIDIRQEQVDSNRKQASRILPVYNQPKWHVGDSDHILNMYIEKDNTILTPVEKRKWLYFKRDDYFCIDGARGGKVRTCWNLAQGAEGVVTAGSRMSPQINIVSKIASVLNIPSVAHTPQGKLSPELLIAEERGTEIIQHKGGYNNVIISRAGKYAKENNYTEIPFGMECTEAVHATAKQVKNIPDDVKRIVMPVGSGMSLAGVLTGLKKYNKNIPVLGVVVGAVPDKRLNKYAPDDWYEMVTLVDAGMDYHKSPVIQNIMDVHLDSIYESKCISFLRKGDLLWVVGIRESETDNSKYPDNNYFKKQVKKVEQFDMVFTCPPYADLEVYSDLKGDISNMPYNDFIKAYTSIIKKACKALKPGGYAVFVVGEIRDKKGNYVGFVPGTIVAFKAAGMDFYNEAILLNAIGTARLRANKQFTAGKKLVKVHQNILVFRKPL